jgi:ClpP class serine protease
MNSNPYAHLASFALESPWAITPGMLREVIAPIIAERLNGQQRDAETIAAAVANRPLPLKRAGLPEKLAIMRIHGVIAPRMNLLTETSGGTTFETMTKHLRGLVRDSTVGTIIFDVDSPGGNVQGATEFAREVRNAAAKKPVIAVANHTMASAAYWFCAGATEIVATPSAVVGSIGVYTIHEDLSAARAQLGVRREYIAAGKRGRAQRAGGHGA